MPVFGPVRSRRLGLSLGVDLVPRKVCSMDCVYCEVGRTTLLTTERAEYRSLSRVMEALERALREKEFDVITITGSGEPTLNLRFPEVVERIRSLTPRPLAVLTNSTLLAVPEVFEALCEVDFVLASLDAAREESFRRVNRPAPGLSARELLENLMALRGKMRGELWLEILLVRGINDAPEDIEALRQALERIRPHRAQLNTVVRPPAEPWARGLTPAEILALSRELSAEPLTVAPRGQGRRGAGLSPEEVEGYLSRRPAPVEELSRAFGVPPEEVRGILDRLAARGRVRPVVFRGETFYRAVAGGSP
ncbi:MAG TPA: radical SAM protein [Thermosulfurimonas dismutans]|uniref:Radical SAM protein n=1 Tax=Thermosulfurimonas dismutans TaxID=999894 RepID=A0A7C3CNJ0_9BACT|nr:radical SAM protein [Thermosulfurimonas dismutans]